MAYLNPFTNISFDRTQQTSFFKKLDDAYYVFAGRKDNEGTKKKHLGLLEIFFFSRVFYEIYAACFSIENPWVKYPLAVIPGFLAAIFWLLNAATAGILTLICSPIIGIVHLLFEPVVPAIPKLTTQLVGSDTQQISLVISGRTPVWKSFLLNPMTWAGCGILTIGISFLIQGLNFSVFIDALFPLTILTGISLLLVVNTAVVNIVSLLQPYLIDNGFREELVGIEKEINALQIEINPSKNHSTRSMHNETNPVAIYFNEWLEWMKEYQITGGIIWGIGLSVTTLAIVFTVLNFTGFAPHFVGQIFDFMFQGIFIAVGNVSMAQVLSAIIFTTAPLILTSMLSRFIETTNRVPNAEIQYSTIWDLWGSDPLGCYKDSEDQSQLYENHDGLVVAEKVGNTFEVRPGHHSFDPAIKLAGVKCKIENGVFYTGGHHLSDFPPSVHRSFAWKKADPTAFAPRGH